jgi:hypothetical protein
VRSAECDSGLFFACSRPLLDGVAVAVQESLQHVVGRLGSMANIRMVATALALDATSCSKRLCQACGFMISQLDNPDKQLPRNLKGVLSRRVPVSAQQMYNTCAHFGKNAHVTKHICMVHTWALYTVQQSDKAAAQGHFCVFVNLGGCSTCALPSRAATHNTACSTVSAPAILASSLLY